MPRILFEGFPPRFWLVFYSGVGFTKQQQKKFDQWEDSIFMEINKSNKIDQ